MRALLVLLLCVGPIVADEKRDAQIREWLNQLDAANYRIREKATKALQDAGAEAAKPLFKVARSGSAEASARAMRILATLA